VTANEDLTVGNLGLNDQDENDMAFLQTLTDGNTTTSPAVTAQLQQNIREIRKNMQQEAQARSSRTNLYHGSAN